jgi:homoserine kinase
MSDSVTVFSPGSVSNVGCGFDIFGYAINDWGDKLKIQKRADNQLVIQEIKGASLSYTNDENIVTVAIRALMEEFTIETGLDIWIEKLIPPGSGLGSSACSANAAVVAFNDLFSLGKTKKELIPFAMKGELVASEKAHADNIAPSMLGGFQVVRSYDPELDIFNIPFPEELITLVIFPQVTIKTSESRKILSPVIPFNDARQQWGNVSGLTTGLITKNWELISKSLDDNYAVPLRKAFIPKYDEAKELCLENNALGFSISGSGPAMFALFRSIDEARKPIIDLSSLYRNEGIELRTLVTSINTEGTKVIGE